MKPLRARLESARRQLGMPWEVLERDYLLSWLLAAIGQVVSLRESLIFKGGTALKKCYFGNYRFSEDLDFSGLPGVPTGSAMEEAISEVAGATTRLLNEYAPVALTVERYTEKEPHPGGQEAFAIRAQFPWHKQPHTRVIIEIAIDERLLKPPVRRKLIHEYGEPLHADIQVYALEEIIAEKLRAILQHIEKLQQRGWSRSRARDYYDLWRILGAYNNQLDLAGFTPFLHEKCAIRKVSFNDDSDFFQEPMMSYVERTWNQWLGPLVPELPANPGEDSARLHHSTNQKEEEITVHLFRGRTRSRRSRAFHLSSYIKDATLATNSPPETAGANGCAPLRLQRESQSLFALKTPVPKAAMRRLRRQ